MIAASKVFRTTWAPSLRRLGVTAFAAVHALGDGASWIWKSVGRVLTGCTQTLDIFHACERLNRCAQAVFGEGTAAATAAYERGRGLLLADGWTGVCAWVAELHAADAPAADAPTPAEQRRAAERWARRRQQATERLVGYFAKHTARLNYRERLASGRAIGSGAVEGQAKTLGLRLKARGARWRMKNVRSMASLVCVRHSVQWEPYWTQAA